MRKLLLASAATMGALLVTTAGAHAQAVKPVAPGTISVHLNGYLQFEFGAAGSSDNTAPSGTAATGTYKASQLQTMGDLRLYPGFDAQTLSGIDYGAQAAFYTTTSNGGRAAQGNTGSTTTGGSEGFYTKRAYGYIGTPEYGFVRFGQTDGAFSLMQTGVIEAFGDGAQFASADGNVAQMIPGYASVTSGNNFMYADQSALYATDKIVYLTPSFLGLSGIASFEPNSNGLKEGYDNNNYVNATSANLSSTPNASDISNTRRKNTVDAMVQYANSFDDVAFKTSAGYLEGSPIAYNGPTTGALAPTAAQKFDNLEVWQAGAQATYAGFSLGANVKGGQVDEGYSFKAQGARDALGYVITTNYVFGPYVIGANFFDSQSSGAYSPGVTTTVGGKKIGMARTLSQYGVAVGGNYVVGKDLSLFVQYEYDHRHQPGNTKLNVNNLASGNAQAQVVAVGGTFKW